MLEENDHCKDLNTLAYHNYANAKMKAYASLDMLQHLPEGERETGLMIRKLQYALLAVSCISMLFTDCCSFMS